MNQIVPMTRVVRALIIINVVIWLFGQMIIERYFLSAPYLVDFFGLQPDKVVTKFFVWQLVTYMFLHSSNLMHILFNMLMLWWLGGELENRWGAKFFTAFYFVSGIGAAVLYCFFMTAYTWKTGSTVMWSVPVVGASGAIFGLLVAYGMIFGERTVSFLMVFPMQAKYFVMILGAMELLNLLQSGIAGSETATLAHLGGIVSGYAFLKLYTRYKQQGLRKKTGKRGRGLKLVVNNKKNDSGGGPKYWN